MPRKGCWQQTEIVNVANRQRREDSGTSSRPSLLDLREPISYQPMHLLCALEDMEVGDTRLVLLDRDPDPLLQQLRPVLQRGLTYQVTEEGSEIWQVLISCGDSTADQ